VPLEPRTVLGDYDAASGRYTVYTGSGGSWRIQADVAGALGVPPAAVRVVARDDGGN
jgi:carbon-monoxide dehydrogenase large subunit